MSADSRTVTKLALSHFTDADTVAPHSVDQSERRANGKPSGFWVSVDGEDDWPAWCDAEDFRDTDAQNRFTVTLADDANVLHLTGFAELQAFTAEFGVVSEWGRNLARQYDEIRWDDVAEKYQGIIIAPYSWQARHDLFWYYAWDCASGCIWDAAAIESVSR